MDQPHGRKDGFAQRDREARPGHPCRPKGRLFRILSLLWLFPSAGALVILNAGSAGWREADNLLEVLRLMRFEQWVALGLLATHLVFGWLAWRSRGQG